MAEGKTTGQVCTGVRRLLRRVSEVKLPQEDIREELNGLCVGYLQQESLSIRERRSLVSPITITPAAVDYAVNLENAPDFEEVMLESALNSTTEGDWSKVNLVSLTQWPDQFDQGRAVGAFYGSSSLATPSSLKLNWTPEQVANRNFRLTYRLPMLTILQYGEKPPLPSGHMPMLEYEAAILLASQVRDNSDEWKEWKAENIDGQQSAYRIHLAELKQNWKDYLSSSVEPQVQPIRPFNSFRRYGSGIRVRPFVPTQ